MLRSFFEAVSKGIFILPLTWWTKQHTWLQKAFACSTYDPQVSSPSSRSRRVIEYSVLGTSSAATLNFASTT